MNAGREGAQAVARKLDGATSERGAGGNPLAAGATLSGTQLCPAAASSGLATAILARQPGRPRAPAATPIAMTT